MLRWLPVHNPQELVQLQMQPSDSREPGDVFSYAIVRALAGQKGIFTGLAGFSSASFNVGLRSADKVGGALVSGAFYETLV